MRKFLLATLLTITIYSIGMAQVTPNCAQTIRLASSTYEQGRLHEVESILEGCLKSGGFNDQEKEAVYKLLTLTYLYLEEPEKADNAMLNLLTTNPYFEPKQASDPAEFIALWRTFRRHPIYRIGVNVGVNASQPNARQSLTTVAESKSDYKYKIGFQFAVTADVPVNEQITLNGSLGYQLKSFELTTTHEREGGLVNTLIAGEKQAWLNIPLAVQYKLRTGKYNPYVAAGVSTDLLISADISAERAREGQTSVEPKSFPIKAQRNPINVSALAAIGSKVRVGGGFIVVEAKYTYGILDVTNDKESYSDQDIYLSYGLPNTTFKLNSLSFTAAYIQNIFKPKKLSRKK